MRYLEQECVTKMKESWRHTGFILGPLSTDADAAAYRDFWKLDHDVRQMQWFHATGAGEQGFPGALDDRTS